MWLHDQGEYHWARKPATRRRHTASIVLAMFAMLGVILGFQTFLGGDTLSSPGTELLSSHGKMLSTNTTDPAMVVATPLTGPTVGGPKGKKYKAPVVSITNLKDTGHSYGIAAGSRLSALSSADLNTELNDIAAMGVTWLRFDIEWQNVQPDNATQQNWSDYDRVINAARAHNFNVLAILDYTPSWARASGCSSAQCPPRDPNEFAAFASQAVHRYAPQGVHAWEIWNEPNNAQFWVPRADPAAYTQLLRTAYGAVKAADSNAVVISAGMAPVPNDGTNVGRREFLMAMYAAGAKGSFDAVADHPYTFPRLPADNTDRAWSEMSTTANSLRATMVANGDGAKKIWITEYGAPTGGPGPAATPADSETVSGVWHVDEQLQANILAEAIQLYKSYDWVGPFFWYANKDSGTSQSSNENFFGLIRADNSKKPAYTTYQQVIR